MKFLYREKFLTWGFPAIIFLLICVAGGFLQYFENIPGSDVANRYAPMAEAFRDGNWQYAFHPRIQPFMPMMGGIFAKLFGLNGFTAMKFAGIFFFALTVFPFYFLNLRLFDRKTAIFSGIFYIFCSRMWLLALTGLRDTGKSFALMLSAYALIMIYDNREKLRYYLLLALGVAIGANCRGDMIFMGGVFMIAGYYMEYSHCRFARNTMISLFAVWLLLLPFILINYFYFGAAVPEIRFGMWYEAHYGVLPGLKVYLLFSVAAVLFFTLFMQIMCRIPGKVLLKLIPSVVLVMLIILSLRVIKSGNEYDLGDFFESLGAGFYPQYGFVALLGFYLMIRAKKMKKEHGLLLFILFFHAIALVMQIMFSEKTFYIGRRYLLSAAPLYFGFSAWTLLDLRRMLTKYVNIKYSYIILAGVCTIFVFIEMLWFGSRLRKSFNSRKHRSISAAVQALRSDIDYEKCIAENNHPETDFKSYVPDMPLIIALHKDTNFFDVLPYCVNGRIARSGEKCHYFVTRDPAEISGRRLVKELSVKEHKFFIVRKGDL